MSKRTNFRNRKISIKQALAILRSTEVDGFDEELLLQNAAPAVESGVDKEEENETHLVAAMSSSHTKPVYIPTPDASRVVAGYEKKFRKPFPLPKTRIRFSATVEDCEGCPYSMDEKDDEWLKAFNLGRKDNTVITEDAFEWIVQQFETTINVKQPFLSTAPDSILSFEELEPSFSEESSVASQYTAFAKFVYPQWRERRVANGGKPIMPLLRYEENAKDDGDPYVCFRRREVRQIRKTRQTGQSATVKLRGLRAEMQQARDLAEMVLRREQLKRQALLADQAVFEKRCLVKDLKRRLGIQGEDEDLVTHKRRRSIEPQVATPTVQKTVRAAAKPEGEAGLLSLEDYYAAREDQAKALCAAKVEALKQKSIGWCDCTNNPYIPLPPSTPSTYFRNITTYYITDNTRAGGKGKGGKGKGGKGKGGQGYGGTGRSDKSKNRQMFRQRIGRGGRLMLDRRSRFKMDHDKENSRWKFDQESDPEDEGIEVDVV